MQCNGAGAGHDKWVEPPDPPLWHPGPSSSQPSWTPQALSRAGTQRADPSTHPARSAQHYSVLGIGLQQLGAPAHVEWGMDAVLIRQGLTTQQHEMSRSRSTIHEITHHAIILVHNNGVESLFQPEPAEVHIRYRCDDRQLRYQRQSRQGRIATHSGRRGLGGGDGVGRARRGR